MTSRGTESFGTSDRYDEAAPQQHHGRTAHARGEPVDTSHHASDRTPSARHRADEDESDDDDQDTESDDSGDHPARCRSGAGTGLLRGLRTLPGPGRRPPTVSREGGRGP